MYSAVEQLYVDLIYNATTCQVKCSCRSDYHLPYAWPDAHQMLQVFTPTNTDHDFPAVLLPSTQTPKNPVTGEPLTPADPRKEGYQATQSIPQGRQASARVLDQLDAKPEGRPFGGEHDHAAAILM